MTDRTLVIGFAISASLHLSVLAAQCSSLNWLHSVRPASALEVIYESEAAAHELRQLQAQLARAKRETVSMASPVGGPGGQTRIRIPERPSLLGDTGPSTIGPSGAGIVDLSNLVEAAAGNPILLSYFSILREQIQQTANRRDWLAGKTLEGVIHVSFLLRSDGSVSHIAIVPDRSAAVDTLRSVAPKIVKTSAPFPAFPPSMKEPNKTVVVPLEFLLQPPS